MDDYYDDDYFEDEFDDGLDDGFEMTEDSTINDGSEIENDSPKDGFTLEEFTFWGGFLGMNIDEERERRRRKKKIEKDILEPDDVFGLEDKDKDY